MADRPFKQTRSHQGYTLAEVLVSLLIMVLLLGGVMMVVSQHMQAGSRLKEKKRAMHILDAAAQHLFRHPELADEGEIRLDMLTDYPGVTVEELPVEDPDAASAGLIRIRLSHENLALETSLLKPEGS